MTIWVCSRKPEQLETSNPPPPPPATFLSNDARSTASWLQFEIDTAPPALLERSEQDVPELSATARGGRDEDAGPGTSAAAG